MPYPQELEYWSEEVSIAFPQMSRSQAQVLALYSYGMAMTKRCGQTMVCVFLALLLERKSHTIRQRLKEFTYEAAQKRGAQRRELVVEAQFEPLLAWVLARWHQKKQLVLGVDVTYLKERYTILCISVLYGQTAIPIAWKVLSGNAQGEWHPLWLALLAPIAAAIPKSVQVLLLFDRGLYSKRLFKAVREYGWHPVMRIREQGLYKRPGSQRWRDLKSVAYRGMRAKSLRVGCFKNDTLEAVLWVQWDSQQDEACLLLSDLGPQQVKGNPYPLRMWIEAGFKAFKSAGLQWQDSQIPDAGRMERLILVMAVALVHLIRLGSSGLDGGLLVSDPVRRLSVVSLGWLRLLAYAIRDLPLTETAFAPYVFPPFLPRKKTYP